MRRPLEAVPAPQSAEDRPTPTQASGVRASEPFPSSPARAEVTHDSVDQTSALFAGPVAGSVPPVLPPLVARACAGDALAMEELARRELPRVQGLLRRLLGPRNDLEDLVQTVFLELCRSLPGFRGESNISTFVGGIAVRVARRAMRPAAWFRLRGAMPEQPPASPDRPHENAVAAEQLRRLEHTLSKLKPDKRVAFVLWALEGHDVPVVAEMTGATVAATRSRIYYAQKELRALASNDPYLRSLLEGGDAG